MLGALLQVMLQCAHAGPPSHTGRDIYDYYCYQCHGYSGDGATVAARFLEPPPRNFTQSRKSELSRDTMLSAVRRGKPGTGMQSFSRVLDARQRAAVVDYIRKAFMDRPKRPLRYHTKANGWVDHDRHAAAFPFATGTLALDREDLDDAQLAGKRLFLSACVSCHEGRTLQSSPVWSSRVVSYPRNAGTCTPCHQSGVSGEMPSDHFNTSAPAARALSTRQQRGRQVFLNNCAFCHAADGTGRNWIGSFLEPHARDLTRIGLRTDFTVERLRQTILEGLPGTSMPAWKGLLNPEDVDTLVDYLSSRHGLSTGSAGPRSFPVAPGNTQPAWKRKIPGAS